MIRHPDTLIGGGLAAGGSAGLTVQIVTQYASLGVLLLNGALALGGLYLLWLRIRKARSELQR